MTVLMQAHIELENLTLTKDVLSAKRGFEGIYGQLAYDGFWHGPLRQALAAFVDETQRFVTGAIRLRLHKGTSKVVGRSASKSLYRQDLATYGPGSTFDQSSARGYIDIFGLGARVWADTHATPTAR